MLALGFENVKIEERFLPNNKWNDPIVLCSHQFSDIPESIISEFKEFSKAEGRPLLYSEDHNGTDKTT